ncbi:MAG TPA: polysaccharide biosynthesis C-terminal domain-containing protein [Phnomibacter sp.]|nr:polysaccharide biosynthesis C-terminal domain-containing protein [Phnomibacter sp.]
MLITIFIQIFKMAAEPFFFAQSNQQEAPKTYARVMKFFVLACCLMFLAVALFLDVWKWMITWKNPEYGEGIHIVPILSMASVFLGIYYNLSIWYKLANKNWIGARITLIGAFITIGLNIWWIPHFGYTGSAWATFVCYLYMMVASYWMGKKYYPIPYATKMLVAYIVLAMLMYSVQLGISGWLKPVWVHLLTGSIFMALYLLLIIRTQRRELARLPLVGKWVSKRRASDSKAKA